MNEIWRNGFEACSVKALRDAGGFGKILVMGFAPDRSHRDYSDRVVEIGLTTAVDNAEASKL